MRLINTITGLFEEFIGRNVPKYAILSHTWEDEEVSFKDMDMGGPSYLHKKGFRKIAMTCQLASQAGLGFAWVDTCCIDKSSSAELTEAINSMYQWYQRAEICYAFLSDVTVPLGSALSETTLQRCRWFTRGWTLQELVAPAEVCFFDCEWNNIGSKAELVKSLSKITGVPTAILRHSQPLSSISVAQKMSWAAHRETSRIEDTAYCLLGIFNVNMPLLYGEEEKAFRRLQEEIMKTTADFSIFAWRWPSATKAAVAPGARIFSGFLADSPRDFSGSESLAKLPGHDRRDFSFSNNTIKTQAQMIFWESGEQADIHYVLPIDCSWDPDIRLGILLRNCGPDQFIRDEPWTFVVYNDTMLFSRPRTRYLLTELPEVSLQVPARDGHLLDMSPLIAQRRLHALQIQHPSYLMPLDSWPLHRWDEEDQVCFVSSPASVAWDSAMVRFNSPYGLQEGQLFVNIELDIIIYVLGWSSLDISRLKYSVIDHKLHASALKEMQAQILGWDSTTSLVLQHLIWHKIPQTSSVVFDVPGQNLAVVVSAEPVLVNKPNVCRNSFWSISITWKLCETQDIPQISDGRWSTDLAYLSASSTSE